MIRPAIRFAAVAALLAAAPASAQTPSQTSPSTPVPAPASPGAATPPNGVARGVISPTRPVDPQMVTRPGGQTKHTMPVITPPGTAR